MRPAKRRPVGAEQACAVDGCGEFTSGSGRVGEWYGWPLCATHRNADALELVMPDVTESWES